LIHLQTLTAYVLSLTSRTAGSHGTATRCRDISVRVSSQF